MKWADITKTADYQALPAEAQQQVKSEYFQKRVLPALEAQPALADIPRDAAFSAWMNTPDDSGQGYFTSLLSSAGRGAASVVPNVVGGVGYLTGSQELQQAGAEIEAGIAQALPVNPVYEQDFAMKAAGAVGQAAGLLATGGLAGGAARGVMLTQGFLSGAREGGQSAEAMGLTGAEAFGRTIVGGGIELGTELVPFGMAAELAGLGRRAAGAAGETVESGFMAMIPKPVQAVLTEASEEGTAQVAGNIADIGFAPVGAQTPGVFDGAGEAALLGAVGGTVFAGAGALAGGGGQAQQPPVASGTAESVQSVSPASPASTLPAVVAPAQPPAPIRAVRVNDNGRSFVRESTGAWSEIVPPAAPGMPPLRLLNPVDAVDGTQIERLEGRVRAQERAAGQPAQPAPPAPPAPPAQPAQPATAAAETLTAFGPPPGAELIDNTAPPLEGQPIADSEDLPQDMEVGRSVSHPPASPGIGVETASTVAAAFAQQNPGAPAVRVVSAAEVASNPEFEPIRAASQRVGADLKAVEGWFQDGQVFLVGDQVSSPERARQVVLHEVVGHGGIEAVALPEEMQQIESIIARAAPDVVENVSRNYPTEDQAGRMRELLARFSETYRSADPANLKEGWAKAWDELKRIVQAIFRRLGGNADAFDDLTLHRFYTRAARAAVRTRERSGGGVARPSVANRDAEYLAAVKAGDLATAQRLVDEAAKAAGFTIGPVWHGTNKLFSVFDPQAVSRLTEEPGFWFTSNRDIAKEFGVNVRPFFLRIKSPKNLTPDEVNLNRIEDVENKAAGLKSQGYSGIVVSPDEEYGEDAEEWLFEQYVVFSNTDIKSADPVTYDDQGNVIPLSQRFQPGSPDIRFSVSANLPTPEAVEPLAPGYRRLVRGFEDVKDTMRQVKSKRDQRTVDGEPVPDVVYNVRSMDALKPVSMQLLDELALMQTSGDAILQLLRDGTLQGTPGVSLDLDERVLVGVTLIQEGRFSDFGLTRSQVLAAMQEQVGRGMFAGRAWQEVLDPINALKVSATDKAKAELEKVAGEDLDSLWAQLENELGTAADLYVDADIRKKVDAVRRQLEQTLEPGELASRLNDIFFPPGDTLAQQLAKDGAEAIANAFFRGRARQGRPGPLQEGSNFVKAELAALLNESLDAIGIARVSKTKEQGVEYRRLVTELGLADMRTSKMDVIDQLVRARIDAYVEEGAVELASDLLDQWEQVSATMLGRAASGVSLRRVINLELAAQETTMSALAGKSDAEAAPVLETAVTAAMEKVRAAGIPEAGGLEADALTRLETEMRAEAQAMLQKARDKAAERKANRTKLQKTPEQVQAEKAAAIVDSLAREMSDTLPDQTVKKQVDPLRALVRESLQAEEDPVGIAERAIALGVPEGLAGRLQMLLLEARRRASVVDEARKRLRMQDSRARAIQNLVDRLAGRKQNAKNAERLSKFLGNLKRADEYGILDKDMFLEAFSNAFSLNYLTPAIARQLRETWQRLQEVDAAGRQVLFGMPRETAEREFMEAVNAVSPGARWDNLIFNSYQAGVLSSVGSMMNQFSGVFRVLAGVDAIARTTARGDIQNFASEWVRNNLDLLKNIPLALTGLRGESLGYAPSSIKNATFKPEEQTVQRTGAGQTLRVVTPGGSTVELSETSRRLLRAKELWTWRTIRGAEAVSGITDAQARFRDVLTEYYRKQGKSAGEANRQALLDINSTPEQLQAFEQRARREQAAGQIGSGEAVLRWRVQQLVYRSIEEKLNTDLVATTEKRTAASQFKTIPVGVIGFPIYQAFNRISQAKGRLSRAGRFFLLFGRFLGHTVDTMLAYMPVAHLATIGTNSEAKRNQIIKETFGDIATYNRMQQGKAAAGAAFLVANGLLMALAEALAGDDEEPFFQIFGTAPLASREQKEALKAAGKWHESSVRIFGQNVNYTQIPELAALFTLLGNASDYVRFSEQLFTKNNEVLPISEAALGTTVDVLTSPIKRSTYRQYVDGISAAMSGRPTDAFANILTNPVGGITRLPVVVDLDKFFREAEGARDAKGIGQNLIRRLPFVHVGDRMVNSYGEQLPGLGVVGMLPPDNEAPEDIKRAATINVETGTVRGTPRLPEEINGEPTSPELKEQFAVLSGQYYVESLLRNETAVRRAHKQGGAEAAKKVVSNISRKANDRARQKLRIPTGQ